MNTTGNTTKRYTKSTEALIRQVDNIESCLGHSVIDIDTGNLPEALKTLSHADIQLHALIQDIRRLFAAPTTKPE